MIKKYVGKKLIINSELSIERYPTTGLEPLKWKPTANNGNLYHQM